jgi:hypothetical protein
MNLIKFGFQYNTENSTPPYLSDLVTESEKAIKMLDPNIQSAYRVKAPKKLKQILNSCTSYSHPHI